MVLQKSLKWNNPAVLLAVNLCIALFFIVGHYYNVYRYAAVGAIFELLAIPLMALLFVVPLIAFFQWRKEHFRFQSLNLLIILFAITTLVMLLWS